MHSASERSQYGKSIYCMISITCILEKVQLYRDVTWVSGCQEFGVRRGLYYWSPRKIFRKMKLFIVILQWWIYDTTHFSKHIELYSTEWTLIPVNFFFFNYVGCQEEGNVQDGIQNITKDSNSITNVWNNLTQRSQG